MSKEVKVRIAPSPTGDPHVGTAYIALFNFLFAKINQGRFILRIEDTDQTRSSRQSEEAIMKSLKWLGLQWDEGPDVGGPNGPYRQSERTEIYRKYGDLLLQKGAAYRCFCTAEHLSEMRKQRLAVKQNPGYDGQCLGLPPEEVEALLQKKTPYVIRMRIDKEAETKINDRFRGILTYQNRELDDQILLKSDGFPTYHLANVVDDHLMGVTHVIRAEEWLSSTPKHIILYRAFDWELPEFIHMPLLRNADKSKISKRKNPVSLEYYRRIGILPEALLNHLALMGWSMPDDREKFSLAEMIAQFDLNRISLSGPIFGSKLEWINSLYIRDMPLDRLTDEILAHQFSRDYIRQIVPLIRERIHRLDGFIPKTRFFFSNDLTYDLVEAIPKEREKKDTLKVLDELTEILDNNREWTTDKITAIFRDYCEKVNWSSKELFMLTRVIVTGSTQSPPLFETMEVIGKALCINRFRNVLKLLKDMK